MRTEPTTAVAQQSTPPFQGDGMIRRTLDWHSDEAGRVIRVEEGVTGD